MSETAWGNDPFEAKKEDLWDFEDEETSWIEFAIDGPDRVWVQMTGPAGGDIPTVIFPRHKVIELVAWLERKLEDTK